MKNWIGRAIILIGIIHTVVGFLVIGQVGVALLREGLFNTVNGEPMREAFFWFIFSGILLIVLGQLIHWVAAQSFAFPAFLGWSLLAITLLGVFIMPASGIWLMFIPCYGLIRRQA